MFDKLFMKNTVISAKFKSAWQKYYKIIIYNIHYKLPDVEDAGAYISENSTHYYLPDWAYLGQKSGQNILKEWSDHKIKAIIAAGVWLGVRRVTVSID